MYMVGSTDSPCVPGRQLGPTGMDGTCSKFRMLKPEPLDPRILETNTEHKARSPLCMPGPRRNPNLTLAQNPNSQTARSPKHPKPQNPEPSLAESHARLGWKRVSGQGQDSQKPLGFAHKKKYIYIHTHTYFFN